MSSIPGLHGRVFFRPQTHETGRHESFNQTLEGEYAFDVDRGEKPPFETYNEATKSLQSISSVRKFN